MSFHGAFAALAEAIADPLKGFGHVLEITLNEAEWDPGDGTLSDEMNLSDGCPSARNKAYDPRIVGWEGGLTQKIEIGAPGLVSYGCTVLIADDDGRVRYALENGNQRHSTARIHRVIQGSETAYDTRFTGLLDTWEYRVGQVLLTFRTDERALWTNHPRWPYLRSEWFQMPLEHEGTYAPLAYGKLDGTGLTDSGESPHGMVPAIPVYFVEGSIGWYALNLAPASFIKDVYVDGVIQTETTNYNKVYGSLAGGKIFTIIEFVTIPAADAVITANLYGYPEATPVVFDGSDVMTNPVRQIRHFLVNFAVNQSRGYIPGAWDFSAPIIDSTSWDAAAAWAAARGLEGSRLIDDQMSASERFREWLESFPQFRAFWSTEGEIELATLTTDWPGYWDGSTPIVGRENVGAGSFSYRLNADNITRRVSVSFLYDYVDGKYLRTLDVEDLSVPELSDTRVEMAWAPSRLVA